MQPRVKFLLVDDLEENLLALAALLRRDDVELLQARSGADALELLLVHDVALAFLDVQMPEMDGFELAELMRGSERTRHVPLIFITAGARDQHRLFKGYETGAVDFLYKPIDPHILKNKADVFFQLYRQKQQLVQELHERTETLRLNEMFAAVLGHDLRNPLSAILTGAQLLQRRSPDEGARQTAARMLSSGKRMSRMIDDMLDLARARLAGGIPMSRTQADLGPLIQRVVQEHQAAFPERRIEFLHEGGLTGEWDPDRLAQVASNLIGNALQHGGSRDAVQVRLDGTCDDVVVLSVANAGCIPAEVLPHIFDPFRGGQRQQGRSEGLGLGLYIAQQIVQAHAGTVDVQSGEGHGDRTTFRVTVPRRTTESVAAAREVDTSLWDSINTERLRAEEQYREQRRALAEKVEQQARIFDTTLSSITDFAYIFDREGRFAYVNQALLNLWGLPLEEAVGKNFFDLQYPDELATKLQRQIQQVFDTGEILRDETPYTSPTGSSGYYEYIFVPVRTANGEIEVVAGSTRDITARRAAERERERLLTEQQELQERNTHLLEAERAARAEAERLGHVKDEFLATLSHELRTPLNAILGWTQILTRGQYDPKAIREGLAVIERNARVQKQLIEDLLDMSRIVSGKVRLDVQRLDLKEIVDAAVLALQPAADAKQIQLTKILDTTGGSLWGDANRLQQVIWNLLSNAIKFTPKGGRIEVIQERVASQIEISVRDTGAGIAPEFLPHVFERFRQSDASTTRAYGGLGLGLAIVKTLVELHGGLVWARSAGLGHGATFIVSLPQTISDPILKPRPESRIGETEARLAALDCAPELLEGVKVLVVDDEADGRQLVGRILEGCSAEVALAGSAQEALDVLASFAPDVLVSDIGMPEIDGYELMRQVRALGPGRKGAVPAAALTALAHPEDRTRALLSGYQTHIAKPVDAVELIAAVAALAGRTGMPS